MIETKECLSGHIAPIYSFGLDNSRDDRLNPYCKNCCRNRVYAEREIQREQKRRASAGSGELSVSPESSVLHEPVIRWSEEAIERESLKRLREQEIAESLKVERVRVEPDPFPKDPFVTRKVLAPRWTCW